MSITVTITGRLTKDAELRQARDLKVCGFSVASDTGFGDRKQTHFFDCSLWGRQGEALCQYLRKGGAVTVIGEFSEREYNGKQYKELRVHTIDLQGSKQDNQNNQQNYGGQQNYQNNYQQPSNQPQQNYNQPQNQNQFGNAQGFSAQPQVNQLPQNPADDNIPF